MHQRAAAAAAAAAPSNPVVVVHVAVGKSLDKAATLLQWTFNHFPNSEIVLIHAYQPSPFIPTLCKLNFFTFQFQSSLLVAPIVIRSLLVSLAYFAQFWYLDS